MAASMGTENNAEYNVLSGAQGGGPRGLGNPNDITLRKVEKEVLIPKIMKYRAHKEKCVPEVEDFSTCGKTQGFLLPFFCRKESKALNQCLEKWYKDDGFRDECTRTYLDERSEYRRTGIGKKFRRM